MLADLGARLCVAVVDAVPGWVVREVERVLDVWCATPSAVADRVTATPTAVDRDALRIETQEAGRRAGAFVARRLTDVLSADVDSQPSTPLEVVRHAVSYPSEVLARAGVPPVVRGRFEQERFPDDVYGLTPASLAAVDPSLAELALAWGAAKAMAHRRRHRTAP